MLGGTVCVFFIQRYFYPPVIFLSLGVIVHFIQVKGKGGWVLGVLLIISVLLFIIADALSWSDKYNGPLTLILSGMILFLIDSKHERIIEGDVVQRPVKLPRIKNRNTLMWIEVRYWGIMFAIVGLVWLINLLS